MCSAYVGAYVRVYMCMYLHVSSCPLCFTGAWSCQCVAPVISDVLVCFACILVPICVAVYLGMGRKKNKKNNINLFLQVHRATGVVSAVARLASFGNLLVFLQQGQYP